MSNADSAATQAGRVFRNAIRSTVVAAPVLVAATTAAFTLVIAADLLSNGGLTGEYLALAIATIGVGLAAFTVVSGLLHAVGEVDG